MSEWSEFAVHFAGLSAIVAVVWIIWRDAMKPRPYFPDRIDRVELGPNDALVIQYDRILSAAHRDALRQHWKDLALTPNNRVIVLDGGARLGVIKKRSEGK